MKPVEAEKFCPVPPKAVPMTVPFHTPVAMVPTEVEDEDTTDDPERWP